MLTKISGILLRTVKHSDSADIITLFTRQRGRMSLISRTGKSKSARMRHAMLAPLAIIETEVNISESKDLNFLGQISTPHPWRNIYYDPTKSAMAFFLTDFLDKLLRTREEDLPLWHFLTKAIRTLDESDCPMANFHIAFLINLLPILGIAPDMESFRHDRYFDMRDGCFTDMRPLHFDKLLPREAAAIPLLQRMNFRNFSKFKFNIEQRRILLQNLMRYYSIHLPVSENLKSLDILKELFD